MTANGPALRLLPRVDDDNRFFWTSGADGQLRFQRCSGCRTFIHPPAPRCPFCLTDTLVPEPVSGRARVESFTVNEQQWIPGSEHYVIAWVSIIEQPDVRLTTNLIDTAEDEVRIGQEVEVVFEEHGEVYLPLFRRVPAGNDVGTGTSR
jgi:uncharacterized OB-fold protein